MPIDMAPPQPNLQGFQIPAAQYTDPLQTLAQIGNLRTQRLQQQEAGLGLQKQQLEMQSMQGLMQAYKDAGGDPEQTYKIAPQYGVLPDHIIGMQAKIAEMANKVADTKLKGSQAAKDALEAQNEEHDQLNQAYGPVWDEKDPTQAQALGAQTNQNLVRQGWDPNKLWQDFTPDGIKQAQALYTTQKYIQTQADAKLKAAQTEEAGQKAAAGERNQVISEITAATDPNTGIVSNPADLAAIQQRHPKVQLPLNTKAGIAQFTRSGVTPEKLPEFDLNTMKARMNMVGNSEYDQFLIQYARSLGKTPAQLTPQEGLASFQKFAEFKQDPTMRGLAIAQKNLAEALQRVQLEGAPTKQDAQMLANDIINHRIAPDQISQIRGRGNGALGLMIEREIKKQNPEFNWEESSAEYNLAKSTGFQNTVRYMDSVNESIPLVIQRAQTLANGNVRAINDLINAGKNQFNNVDLKKFNTDRALVADEIAKILQGGGTGGGTSDMKLKQAGEILSSSDSPAAIAASLKDVQQLIGFRRKALTRGTYLENAQPAAGGQQQGGGAAATPGGKRVTINGREIVPRQGAWYYKDTGERAK